MTERLRKVLRKYLIIFGVGVAYLVWVLITDLRIPCPIYSIFGIECPGCGVTRMIASIARFDFSAAFGYNPFLLVTSPLILLIIGVGEYNYVRQGEWRLGVLRHTLIPLLALAIAFGVVRNII